MHTAADKHLSALEKDLRFITREVSGLSTSDFESVDAINAALRDMKAELEALRLALAPDATDDLSLPEAA